MTTSGTPWTPLAYPASRKSNHVDTYKSEKQGEVRVQDPFNWLEENSSETAAWTTAQADFTREFLDRNPHRNILEQEIRANSDYEKVSRVLLGNPVPFGRLYLIKLNHVSASSRALS